MSACDRPVQSVHKALDLLNLLVFDNPEREEPALGDLAGRLGFPARIQRSDTWRIG